MPQIKSESKLVSADVLSRLARDLLKRAGLSEVAASLVADSLVESNLRGIDSHGVARLPHYLQRIEMGSINGAAVATFEQLGPSLGIVDGHHGLGQIAMWEASERATELASATGAGWVAVKNSSHCGALAYFGQHLARGGMAAIVFTHSDAMVAPFGATAPFCGTNPICLAIPGPDDQHICLDMATSCVPWNTVMNAGIEGMGIPPDWGVDRDGQPTTDPSQVAALRPAAGYKGSGLGLLIDLLCALPGGGPIGPDLSKMYGDLGQRRLLGGLVGAMDLSRFKPLQEVMRRVGEAAARWNHLQPENADEPVLWPGQPELLTRRQRLTDGIPVGIETLAQLNKLSSGVQNK